MYINLKKEYCDFRGWLFYLDLFLFFVCLILRRIFNMIIIVSRSIIKIVVKIIVCLCIIMEDCFCLFFLNFNFGGGFFGFFFSGLNFIILM